MYLIKSFLVATVAGGIALSAQADHIPLSKDYLLLHSRGVSGPSSYFSTSDPYNNTSAFSSVGGNIDAGGSYFTSSHYDVVGVRSAAFMLDSDTLGLTLSDLYSVEITWGTQTNLQAARVTITHADGIDEVFLDQSATSNEWVALGTFAFTGAVGEEIRIWNNGRAGESVSGNIQYDSVQLTAIPEPSTYAAIFGGLALVGAFVYRRRRMKATE